ncbi:MAG: hypothetical protein D3916_09480 [Candidatus Electrothrix sp. MAN1_4]|nr:hypothetical protein [Candidatus Electrothrix sp. MAN1_4]
MLKSKVFAAAIFSLGLFLGAQADAQAMVGARGIAFCANGEELWIDVGPNFYHHFDAKAAFDNEVYSACRCKGGLSFFTRTYYNYPDPPSPGTSCPLYQGTPYWSN